MNGLIWHCTGRLHDTLGCLGTDEAEANGVRLERYRARAVHLAAADEIEFFRRIARGLSVKRRARHAGMGTALAYVVTAGQRIALHGPRAPKPEVIIGVDGSALLAAMDELSHRIDRLLIEHMKGNRS